MLETHNSFKKTYQIINEEGNIVDEQSFLELDLSDEELLNMYQWMLRGRIFDNKLMKLQRQGRVGTSASLLGQEAAQVGIALNHKEHDWVVPSYRENLVSMILGIDYQNIFKAMKGFLGGGVAPKNINLLTTQVIIAGQTLHAVGISWASKLRGEDSVTTCYFGDGATSQGDFHEALNFASVYNLPVVFYCQNNQYAISVPLEKQMASETIAQKAVAYGMKGIRVDGNDVIAVYKVAKEAIERARRGEGPMLIEAFTYRQGSHTTADDWTKYRSKEEVELWTKVKDPIVRFEAFLKNRGLFSSSFKEKLTIEVEEEIEVALAEVEALTPPPSYETFDYVYDQPHPELTKQKAELRNRLEDFRGEQNG